MNNKDIYGDVFYEYSFANGIKDKYIVDFKHTNVKLLCVICNEIKFTNSRNKAYTLFRVGYENNTLCYINNLREIIFEYFNL